MATMLLLWMLIMNLQPLPPNPTVNLASVSLYLSCRRWVLLICFQVLIFAFPLNPFEKKFMLILTDNYVVINFYVINERQHSWFLLLLSSVWYHIDKQILYANCPQKNLFYICFFFFLVLSKATSSTKFKSWEVNLIWKFLLMAVDCRGGGYILLDICGLCFGGGEFGQGQGCDYAGNCNSLGSGRDGSGLLCWPHLWCSFQPSSHYCLCHLQKISSQAGKLHQP